MPVAHINIGSNLGDSRSSIEQAIAGISVLSGKTLRRSSFVESESWGYDSPHSFLNIGVEIDTLFIPQALLASLLAIQHAISSAPHRTPAGAYADRVIDIDLIYYDTQVIELPAMGCYPSVTLPHPRMHMRRFVLLPLAELSPCWKHPLLHLTPRQMLDRL